MTHHEYADCCDCSGCVSMRAHAAGRSAERAAVVAELRRRAGTMHDWAREAILFEALRIERGGHDPKSEGSAVECVVCRRRKCPRGRSAPMQCLCDENCPGYHHQPLPGDLWPGETREEFGCPCSTAKELEGVGPVWRGEHKETKP